MGWVNTPKKNTTPLCNDTAALPISRDAVLRDQVLRDPVLRDPTDRQRHRGLRHVALDMRIPRGLSRERALTRMSKCPGGTGPIARTIRAIAQPDAAPLALPTVFISVRRQHRRTPMNRSLGCEGARRVARIGRVA
jgi:hypothetical protein